METRVGSIVLLSGLALVLVSFLKSFMDSEGRDAQWTIN